MTRYQELDHLLHRAEIELLANWAPSLKQGWTILNSSKVTYNSFAGDDTRAIFIGFEVGMKYPGIERAAHLAKRALEQSAVSALLPKGLWDNDDNRMRFPIQGRIWGPGLLSTLMLTLSYSDRGMSDAIGRFNVAHQQVVACRSRMSKADFKTEQIENQVMALLRPDGSHAVRNEGINSKAMA